jgi:uncharacterized membrane protein
MPKLDPRLGAAATAQTLLFAAGAFAHSVRARGWRRSLLLLALGTALPVVAEYTAINRQGLLRHHVEPQVKNVPLFVVGGWYLCVYATYAMLERVLADAGLRGSRALLPLSTALVAADFDLLADAFGLDQGLWEWRDGGPYAAEIAGVNGQSGIPVGNYVGWLVLAGGVTGLCGLIGGDAVKPEQPGAAGSAQAGQQAALLILPQYLGAAGWALRTGRWRYLLLSLPFLVVLLLALRPQKAIKCWAAPP